MVRSGQIAADQQALRHRDVDAHVVGIEFGRSLVGRQCQVSPPAARERLSETAKDLRPVGVLFGERLEQRLRGVQATGTKQGPGPVQPSFYRGRVLLRLPVQEEA